MVARYYEAPLGRFLSVDPSFKAEKNLSNPQRWNRYTYSLNNPITMFDPDGRDVALATKGNSNAVKSFLVSTAMRPSGRAGLQTLASDHSHTTTFKDEHINSTQAVKEAAQPGSNKEITFETTDRTSKGAEVAIDTYAVSHAASDRSGVTTTAHGIYHAEGIQAGQSDAELAKGDQPTSATGPAEAFGASVSKEKPDISRKEAEKVVDQMLTKKKP